LVTERLKNEKLAKVQYENQLNDLTEQLQLNKEELEKLEQDLDRVKSDKFSQLTKRNKSVTETVLKISQSKQDWDTFMEFFKKNYHNFLEKLRSEYPNLTSNDLRLCALLKMNLSSKEIASILNITTESLRKSKYRLRKKLSLEENQSLDDYLLKM